MIPISGLPVFLIPQRELKGGDVLVLEVPESHDPPSFSDKERLLQDIRTLFACSDLQLLILPPGCKLEICQVGKRIAEADAASSSGKPFSELPLSATEDSPSPRLP